MTIEQAGLLAEQVNCNGSKLTPEQRRSIYKLYLALHLKDYSLQSPQHYPYFEEKSEPASAPETAWPGAMGYEKANHLKRSYIEPEDLIKRLSKLKSSDNFKPRMYRHPTID